MDLDVCTLVALLAWASLLQAMALGIQFSFSYLEPEVIAQHLFH